MTDTHLQAVVSRNIRVLMAVRGIETQKDLAAQLGWFETKLTKSLRGDRKWSLEDLSALATAFGVQPADLIDDVSRVVNVAAPARTGTDSVTGGVTRRYAAGNGARILQFPQRTGPQRRYRARKNTTSPRIAATSMAAVRSGHLTAAAAG
jgi:hypothetical protein